MNDEVEELEVIVKKIRYKDVVWIPESEVKKTRNNYPLKQNYFQRWLTDKQVGSVFSLDDFFKKYPRHKKDSNYRKRLDRTISDLIKDGKIDMWTKKDEFKVLK